MRLGRARAPNHASAAYRSWTWLLLEAVVAIVIPWRQAKFADFIAHRAQAHPEQLSRPRPVTAGRFQGHGKKLALHFAEREARLPFRRWRWDFCRRDFAAKICFMFQGFDANLAAMRQSHRPPDKIC